MSLPIISYHYITTVTVRSSNRHPVCAGCLVSRHVLLGHLEPWRWHWLVIPIGMKLPLYAAYNPRSMQVSKQVQFQCVFPSGECQMVNNKCVLWHNLRKHCPVGYTHMTSHVNRLVLLLHSTKVPTNLKTMIYETFNFWYHINKIHTHRSTSLL